MSAIENWELASYVVTVFGLPLAIALFIFEQRKERDNEDGAAYQILSDAYQDFLKLVLDNADLRLRSASYVDGLSAEQLERQRVLFEMLVSLFERAYILAYEPGMRGRRLRRWRSWEDYMREWCAREDFRKLLPALVRGEDADFAAYIQAVANDASRPAHPPST